LKEISEITGVTVRMVMRTLRKKSMPLRRGERCWIGDGTREEDVWVLGGECGHGIAAGRGGGAGSSCLVFVLCLVIAAVKIHRKIYGRYNMGESLHPYRQVSAHGKADV